MALDWIIMAVFVLGVVMRQFIAFFYDGLFLILCILLWNAAVGFRSFIKNGLQSGKISDQEVMNNFKAIKELAAAVNAVSDKQILLLIMEGLYFNSVFLHNVLITDSFPRQFRNFTFLVIVSAFFCLSGEACKAVETGMFEWLNSRTENMKGFMSDMGEAKVNVILAELKTKPVGLSGYMFVLTYSSFLNVS